MELVRKLLAILELLFLSLYAPVFVEDNVIREKILTYSSNCLLDFKHHNISCSYIELYINGTTVAEGDSSYIWPITEFNRTEGFKVDSCQTVSVRCIKDGIETHYVAQEIEDAKNNVKEDSGDSNSAWIICVAVGIPIFLIILGLIVYYWKVHRRDKDHLPFCCKFRKKAPSEDPAAAKSLCESQEAL